MFALSLCLSVTNEPGSASLCGVIGGSACSVHCVPCVRGDSVQPSPNAFGLLFLSVFRLSPSYEVKYVSTRSLVIHCSCLLVCLLNLSVVQKLV